MEVYRGVTRSLNRYQVDARPKVSLAVRAALLFIPRGGERAHGVVDGGTGQEWSKRTQGDGHLRWCHAGGGGHVGKPVHAVHGQYICIQVSELVLFCERSFRIGEMPNTEYSSRVWLPCRRVHFAC